MFSVYTNWCQIRRMSLLLFAFAGAFPAYANLIFSETLTNKFAASDEGPDLASARTAFNNGDVAGAREQLGKIISVSETLPHPDVQLALWYFNSDREAEGSRTMERLAKTESGRADVRYLFAEIARDEGRYFDAWTHLSAAESARPRKRWSAAYNNHMALLLLEARARTALARADWLLARDLFSTLNGTSLGSAECDLALGQAEFFLNNPTAAEIHFRAAADRNGEDEVIPELVMARLYNQREDTEETELWFKQGIKLENPEDVEFVRLEYLRWLMKQNRPVDARKVALSANPRAEQARSIEYTLALTDRMRGQYVAAEKRLTGLFKKEPGNFQVSNQLALVLLESAEADKREQGFVVATRNVKALPNAENAVATYAWFLHRRGDSAQAEQLFNRILQGGKASRDTAFYVSEIKLALGKPDEAAAFLQAAQTSKGEFFNRHRLEEK
jgi:predicted Zn-dependent protease